MALDINRLGRAVRERRDELDMTQLDVASAGGPSNSTLTKLESGEADAVSAATLRKLDAGLDWQAGTARALLRGEVPVSAMTSSLEEFTDVELAEELARRIRQREDVRNHDSSAASTQAPGSGADVQLGHHTSSPVPESASDSFNVTQFPSAAALDPTLPDDVAARDEGQPSKTQRARERQDKETEGP